MATIILSYDETSFVLKQDCARYVKIPEIKVHFEALRIKDMVIIRNLEKAPLYIYQEDFVDCYLDEVLTKATVHAHAKIYYDCKKVDGVWKKNEDSFIYVLYPTSPPNSPTHSPIKRKYIAQVEEEEMDRRVNQAIRN
jgi:hypothetical protein